MFFLNLLFYRKESESSDLSTLLSSCSRILLDCKRERHKSESLIGLLRDIFGHLDTMTDNGTDPTSSKIHLREPMTETEDGAGASCQDLVSPNALRLSTNPSVTESSFDDAIDNVKKIIQEIKEGKDVSLSDTFKALRTVKTLYTEISTKLDTKLAEFADNWNAKVEQHEQAFKTLLDKIEHTHGRIVQAVAASSKEVNHLQGEGGPSDKNLIQPHGETNNIQERRHTKEEKGKEPVDRNQADVNNLQYNSIPESGPSNGQPRHSGPLTSNQDDLDKKGNKRPGSKKLTFYGKTMTYENIAELVRRHGGFDNLKKQREFDTNAKLMKHIAGTCQGKGVLELEGKSDKDISSRASKLIKELRESYSDL